MHFNTLKMKVVRSTKNKFLHKGRFLHPSIEEKKTNVTYVSVLSSTPVLSVGSLGSRKCHIMFQAFDWQWRFKVTVKFMYFSAYTAFPVRI